MANTVYDFARSRGVNLQPHEVESWVNSLPEHDRQEALLLVLANDAPKTPGHIFPSREAEFTREVNTKTQKPEPSSSVDLPPRVRVHGHDLVLHEGSWVKYFEYGTLKLRVEPFRAEFTFGTGVTVSGTGASANAAFDDMIASMGDAIADMATALDSLSR